MAKILESTTALTIARDTDGRQRYLYRGQTVDAAALDPEDAERLLELGHLAEYAAPVDPDEAEPAKKSAPAKKAAAAGGAS
ncbi:hypothetical protein GCM10028801_41190 [Nocardioides maradonensis]